ncbi:MAG: 5'-methylthioadenosine phosphorylase [Desulfurococcales archaeon ex4484_58]|nr:MAG: 5'-methylthioadenosine phosphorylase [Desulfurococcales archaeon ex4484_58]
MSGPPFHIRAKPGDIAENVIVVGDPGRVLIIKDLLENTRVVNEHRGLLTITGEYRGTRVTVATHGIGSPSASIVFEELGMLGAKRIVRIGTAGGLKKELRIGEVVVASSAIYTIGGCGLAQYFEGVCAPTAPHPILTTHLIETLEERGIKYYMGPVYSSDAFYAEDPGFAEKWSRHGVLAVEMEAATLFSLGWMRGWETAAVLVISDNLVAEEKYMATSQELREKILKVSETVLEVFKNYY